MPQRWRCASSSSSSRALAAEGVEVCVAEDSVVPVKPDAVFPNNWVSFHACGTLVLYPLANAEPPPRAPPGSHRCRRWRASTSRCATSWT